MNKIKTIKEYAEELGISRQRLHKFITDHDIPVEKFGNIIMLTPRSINKIQKLRKTA